MIGVDSLEELRDGVEAGWPWGDVSCLSRSPFTPCSTSPSLAASSCYKHNRSWSTCTSISLARQEQCGAAYFSTKPPTTPLRLISPAPAAARFSSLPKVETAKYRQEIKSLLSEMIATLPLRDPEVSTLLPPSQPLQRVLSSAKLEQSLEEREVPQSKKSCQSMSKEVSKLYSGCNQNWRSIAIQTQRMKADVGTTKTDDVSERRSVSEEWLGGVRALRDAHTRLVLRQLRHITRLNRAIDRVAAK